MTAIAGVLRKLGNRIPRYIEIMSITLHSNAVVFGVIACREC